MEEQHNIKRKLTLPASIDIIRSLAADPGLDSRTKLAKRVCEEFSLCDTLGHVQTGSCVKALRDLEKAGLVTLPAPTIHSGRKPGTHAARRLPQPVAPPDEVPAHVQDIQDLHLERVQTDEQLLIWNELMESEHPLGAGPLVGRQLRYLVGSRHGWLGGIGYGASALQLADRDAWIGWTGEQRRKYLYTVVGMNRFLIRPMVDCENLASKVLGMGTAVLAADFEERYGYRPLLLESFVDTGHYTGASYKAANWTAVGTTKGRGRQDRRTQAAAGKKAIYMYVLEQDFRMQLALDANAGKGALPVGEGLEGDLWAAYEFGGADLGDKRLNTRLVEVAAAKAKDPGAVFSEAVGGKGAKVKGYYRMIDKPEQSGVSMESIMAPHRERTIRRMMAQKTVLCIQDGSELNYTNLEQCDGLGVLGANQTGAKSRGLHLHSTFTVAPNGLPLGVLKAQARAPQPREPGDNRKAPEVPIEEKKSFLWIEHHRDLVEVAKRMPHTRLVDVCDREADFFELFDEQRKQARVELLTRAHHNRSVKHEEQRLFDLLRGSPELGSFGLVVPRQSARPKKSRQTAQDARTRRTVQLVVHAKKVRLMPPAGHEHLDPIDIWAVHAVEAAPPQDEQAIEWFLLTTLEVETVQQAQNCLGWYSLRWRIEDWHRVLKSGCRIEELKHESAERLRRAIAINLVIAWRIMLMTLMGRQMPGMPAELVFSDIEIRTLQAYAKKKKLKSPTTVGEAVQLVAAIGGHVERKNAPPPGHQVLWRGYSKLGHLCEGFSLLYDG
jgi:hypothetical protein